jgi:hypothetical protein
MRSNLIVLILLSFQWSSAKVVEFSEFARDVKIPKQVWKELGEITGKNVITFGEVKVTLKEKNPGVLIEPEIHFRFPKGGGIIDLSNYIQTDNPGTLFVFIEVVEGVSGDGGKIFFIPQTKKRKIDGDVWGAGCNKYLDVKKFILGEGQKKGIEVNTTDFRHLSVIGGSFFIANGLEVAQVTFQDSQQKSLFCDGFFK